MQCIFCFPEIEIAPNPGPLLVARDYNTHRCHDLGPGAGCRLTLHATGAGFI
jgi:hypothetical protein